VRRCVWSRNLVNAETLALCGAVAQKKPTPRKHSSCLNFTSTLIYIATVFLTSPTRTITVFRDVTLFRLLDTGLRTTGSDCTLLVAATVGARQVSISPHTSYPRKTITTFCIYCVVLHALWDILNFTTNNFLEQSRTSYANRRTDRESPALHATRRP
jgi:hypothetical protein